MDDLTYEALSWLAAGNSVFRPLEATAGAEEAFRTVVSLLDRLQGQGLVTYLNGHVTQTKSGIYLMVGPVHITSAGMSALERDRRMGARPPWGGDPLPWRL